MELVSEMLRDDVRCGYDCRPVRSCEKSEGNDDISHGAICWAIARVCLIPSGILL